MAIDLLMFADFVVSMPNLRIASRILSSILHRKSWPSPPQLSSSTVSKATAVSVPKVDVELVKWFQLPSPDLDPA